MAKTKARQTVTLLEEMMTETSTMLSKAQTFATIGTPAGDLAGKTKRTRRTLQWPPTPFPRPLRSKA